MIPFWFPSIIILATKIGHLKQRYTWNLILGFLVHPPHLDKNVFVLSSSLKNQNSVPFFLRKLGSLHRLHIGRNNSLFPPETMILIAFKFKGSSFPFYITAHLLFHSYLWGDSPDGAMSGTESTNNSSNSCQGFVPPKISYVYPIMGCPVARKPMDIVIPKRTSSRHGARWLKVPLTYLSDNEDRYLLHCRYKSQIPEFFPLWRMQPTKNVDL